MALLTNREAVLVRAWMKAQAELVEAGPEEEYCSCGCSKEAHGFGGGCLHKCIPNAHARTEMSMPESPEEQEELRVALEKFTENLRGILQ